MASKMQRLAYDIAHAYGEVAELAGRILTHPELSREDRIEASAWADSYLAQFEKALGCSSIYDHILEERFAHDTGLAHLILHLESLSEQ